VRNDARPFNVMLFGSLRLARLRRLLAVRHDGRPLA
jgi:hypothetical protein